MQQTIVVLLVVVAFVAGCDRQATRSSAATQKPTENPLSGSWPTEESLRDLRDVFDRSRGRLEPGDCAPGTGRHQVRGGESPKAGERVVPCEPTAQLQRREPELAKKLAELARRVKDANNHR